MILTQGEKVSLRLRVSADYLNEQKWASDHEISALDPSVDSPVYSHIYSIDTLDGIHIGYCAAYDFQSTGCQVGIRIGEKQYWDKGYGTDATNALIDFYFKNTAVTRIWVKVLPTNIRAQRCYEKCGFVVFGKIVVAGYDLITMERRK